MTPRRLFLDQGTGEVRGVVTLDDRPERLLIRRDDDDPRLILGAVLAARVSSLEPALSTAFLDLGEGAEAILSYKPDAKPVRGQMLRVEIRSEPRAAKLAVARALGEETGPVRLLHPAPELREVLCAYADGSEVEGGLAARQAADDAEIEALEVIHPLPGGGTLAVEPTRALTAIDVDLGGRPGTDSKRAARQANVAALKEAARLLRLKGLGGIVVIDLVGRGHDGPALLATARTAFGPDNPGVAIGPVGRFGTLEISLPRRRRPVLDRLCREDGRPSDRTLAQRLVRRLEAEATAQPGARLVAACDPAVAALLRSLVDSLSARMGARFRIDADPARSRDRSEVWVE